MPMNRYIADADLGAAVYSVAEHGDDLYVALAAAARETGPSLILVGQAVTVDQDLTVESRMKLIVGPGAIITVNNGFTLTIDGSVDAGRYQIFDTSPGGAVTGSLKCPAIYPEWFGAVGDGTTDDTTPLQDALDLAKDLKDSSLGYRAIVDLGNRYFATTGVTVYSSTILRNGGINMIKDDVAGIALTVFPVLGTFYLQDVAVNNIETSLAHTGIKIVRGLYGVVDRTSSTNFDKGLYLEGTYLSSFNDVNLGANRIGLYCWTYDTGSVRDSCSSCTFTNCSFQTHSPSGTDYGVYASEDDTGKRSVVNFRFDRCLFQSVYSVTPVYLQDALYTTVDNCYFEASNIWTILVDGGQVVRVMRNQVNTGNIGFTGDCADCVYAYNIIPGTSTVVNSGLRTTIWANRATENDFELGSVLDSAIIESPTLRAPVMSGLRSWIDVDHMTALRRSSYGPYLEEHIFEDTFAAGDGLDHNVLTFTIPALYTGGTATVDYQIATNFGRGFMAGQLLVGLGVYSAQPGSGVVSEIDSVNTVTGSETITAAWNCTASGLDINLVVSVDSNLSPTSCWVRGLARCVSAKYNRTGLFEKITIRDGEPDV